MLLSLIEIIEVSIVKIGLEPVRWHLSLDLSSFWQIGSFFILYSTVFLAVADFFCVGWYWRHAGLLSHTWIREFGLLLFAGLTPLMNYFSLSLDLFEEFIGTKHRFRHSLISSTFCWTFFKKFDHFFGLAVFRFYLLTFLSML